MLQWTLGLMSLSKLLFYPDICPGVGLQDHMITLVMSKYVPFITPLCPLVESLFKIINGCSILSKTFSESIEMIIWFLFFNFLICHINILIIDSVLLLVIGMKFFFIVQSYTVLGICPFLLGCPLSIDSLLGIKSFLRSWSKAHLTVVYDSFIKLLNLVC